MAVSRFQPKKRTRNAILTRGLIVVLVFLVLVVGRATWKVYQKKHITEVRLEVVQKEYEELSDRERFLEDDIERLRTGIGVEEEIRERFGYGRDGEKAIIVVQREEEKETDGEEDIFFWNRVKNWIFE